MSDMNLGTTDSRSDSMQSNDSFPEARSGRGRIDISSVVRVAETHRLEDEAVSMEVKQMKLSYGENVALHGIDMLIPKKRVTAFIGPSGCGKSTLLRCFNRMNDLVDDCRIDGEVLLEGEDIYRRSVEIGRAHV